MSTPSGSATDATGAAPARKKPGSARPAQHAAGLDTDPTRLTDFSKLASAMGVAARAGLDSKANADAQSGFLSTYDISSFT
jgi:hypothetical protein